MHDENEDESVVEIVKRVWEAFKCSTKAGQRKTVV